MTKLKIALIASLGLNLLLILDESCTWDWIPTTCDYEMIVEGYPCACVDSLRYPATRTNSGREIDTSLAKLYVTDFQTYYKELIQNNSLDLIKGGFISKIALDSMFCSNPLANGVFCFMGLDVTNNNSMFMLFETTTIRDQVDITFLTSGYDPRSRVVKSDVTCPMVCEFSICDNPKD